MRSFVAARLRIVTRCYCAVMRRCGSLLRCSAVLPCRLALLLRVTVLRCSRVAVLKAIVALLSDSASLFCVAALHFCRDAFLRPFAFHRLRVMTVGVALGGFARVCVYVCVPVCLYVCVC